MNTDPIELPATEASHSGPTKAEATKAEPRKVRSSKSKTELEPLVIKAAVINQAWAEEVVCSFGLSGQVVKAVAAQLTSAITAAVSKQTTRRKLAKLVRIALAKTIA